jgi:zinc protease
MRPTQMLFLLLLPVLLAGAVTALAQKPAAADVIDIPYKKFVLDNGLTVIIHEDHKAPIVAVNVWYHVGSKNEKYGKSGFAHLFEHLMFNGSENFNDDYFQTMERIGATDLNGTTSEDRTNYFQNVPTSAFDLALWMESDRMGHLLGVVTQAKLDEQRGVVQNEKRQGENQPYAMADDLIVKAVWPAGHPYSHTVIGSMEDLNAASLDDVKEWFKTYYGPANAVLGIAGDVETGAALEKVKKYFGDIPSGPPVARAPYWTARRTGTIRQTAQDRVPQARIFKVWNVPGWGTKESVQLSLLGNILSSGKTSRLYKRLVYDDQTATNVNVYVDQSEIAGLFAVDVTAKPGGDIAKVEQAIDEEFAKVFAKGVTEAEVARVKTVYESNFIRGLERIGGFGGKSDILAQNEVYGGSPDLYKTRLLNVKAATAKEILETAKAWLSDGVYVLQILPFPTYTAAAADTTLRKTMPKPGAPPVSTYPSFEKATMSNGLKVMLVPRATIPFVNLLMLFDGGYSSDQFSKPGTASLAMNMMDEGTTTRSALQISEELQQLGAGLGTNADLDYGTVSLNSLTSKLDAALNLYADVILNPSFPQADLDRLKQQTLASIQREKAQPMQMGMRVLPGLLFGKDHAYATPFTGSGYESTVKTITRDDVVGYHKTWIKPNNATLLVVGDVTMQALLPKLEKVFQGWKSGDVPRKNISVVKPAEHPVVYLIDKPGAQQSVIFAAQLAMPANNPGETAIAAMNSILGGAFTSRINMNLREGKHWSYGARAMFLPTRNQRPYMAMAPVQTDKTRESMVEITKEFTEYLTTRPPTADEVTKAKGNMALQLPGRWETNSAILGSMNEVIRYGWPEDYYQGYGARLGALSQADIAAAAKSVIAPSTLVWVVVGDRNKIEKGIRELNYGELKLVDPDGKPVQ